MVNLKLGKLVLKQFWYIGQIELDVYFSFSDEG